MKFFFALVLKSLCGIVYIARAEDHTQSKSFRRNYALNSSWMELFTTIWEFLFIEKCRNEVEKSLIQHVRSTSDAIWSRDVGVDKM
ncbi:hypothetical protein Y032_0643g1063 [Ancylostoma ceylanicum]|uniref:Secreted protein n=1 Tax=Ancylostoma ceylanicum TaxID=53326 RepID=A0A016WIS3_9BILA|nr:hypothetical protein Y032_0643g1063 [Ancylostoma ceylanicum]